jgi:hypothetical protein
MRKLSPPAIVLLCLYSVVVIAFAVVLVHHVSGDTSTVRLH